MPRKKFPVCKVVVRDSTDVERMMDDLLGMIEAGPDLQGADDNEEGDEGVCREFYKEWMSELRAHANDLQYAIKLEQAGKVIRRPM